MAVTAGSGTHRKFAALLAERFTKINAFPCVDISDDVCWKCLPDPYWVKPLIWQLVPDETERVLWLDADVFPITRVGPLPAVPFAAVQDIQRSFDADKDTYPPLEGVKSYCNAGVFVAERSATEELFKEWQKESRARQRSIFRDQGPLNALLHRHFGGFTELPMSWNWLVAARPKPEHPVMAHFAGFPIREKALEILYAIMEGDNASAHSWFRAVRTDGLPRSDGAPALVLQPQGENVRVRFRRHGAG